MSITSDLRGYADTAVTQGKQFVGQAQAQLNELSGSAKENVNGLKASLSGTAEKALNVDALKAAVEPYLEQARSYSAQVSERAEAILNRAKADPRVAKVLDSAESLTSTVFGPVVDAVQERVLKPLQQLRGGKPAPKRPAPKPAPKPAATESTPATAKAQTKPAPKTARPRKSTARKATTKA